MNWISIETISTTNTTKYRRTKNKILKIIKATKDLIKANPLEAKHAFEAMLNKMISTQKIIPGSDSAYIKCLLSFLEFSSLIYLAFFSSSPSNICIKINAKIHLYSHIITIFIATVLDEVESA
jgi:hypothetical protein